MGVKFKCPADAGAICGSKNKVLVCLNACGRGRAR